MQRELTFYNELNIVKTSKAFKVYAWSYSVEVKDSKDPLVQLKISRPSIKYLCNDLLTKLLLNKYKENAERKFASAYSITKTVIGPEDSIDSSFQKFLTGFIIGLAKDLAG